MHARNLLKPLGLMLLTAVGVMAVSAAGAQAAYQLLKNGEPVNLLTLTGVALLSVLELEEGFSIHCEGGSIEGHLETAGGGEKLLGSLHTLYEGCSLLGAEKVCSISEEPEAGDGHILFSVEGEAASMTGEDTSILAIGEPFAVFYIEGVQCPLGVLGMTIEGTLSSVISEGETDQITHLGDTQNEELFFGKSRAFLSGEAHLQEETGATWAIDLT